MACITYYLKTLLNPYRLLVQIMMSTAGMMSRMPVSTCQVKASPNTRQPTITAVSGSSAPNTATIVLPMRFTLYTKLMLVINVHITERAMRCVSCSEVVIGLKLPWRMASAPKIRAPINMT